jgi:hypothetical protein
VRRWCSKGSGGVAAAAALLFLVCVWRVGECWRADGVKVFFSLLGIVGQGAGSAATEARFLLCPSPLSSLLSLSFPVSSSFLFHAHAELRPAPCRRRSGGPARRLGGGLAERVGEWDWFFFSFSVRARSRKTNADASSGDAGTAPTLPAGDATPLRPCGRRDALASSSCSRASVDAGEAAPFFSRCCSRAQPLTRTAPPPHLPSQTNKKKHRPPRPRPPSSSWPSTPAGPWPAPPGPPSPPRPAWAPGPSPSWWRAGRAATTRHARRARPRAWPA